LPIGAIPERGRGRSASLKKDKIGAKDELGNAKAFAERSEFFVVRPELTVQQATNGGIGSADSVRERTVRKSSKCENYTSAYRVHEMGG
jgi:hypothetical protein